MRLHRHAWSGAACFALLAGCSSTVVGSDAAVVDAPVDARPDAPVDAGPVQRECGANRDCASDEVCEYAQGCATTRGRCVSNACQSLPVAPQYCGCEGATLQQTSACLPDRPWRSMGPCADAGS